MPRITIRVSNELHRALLEHPGEVAETVRTALTAYLGLPFGRQVADTTEPRLAQLEADLVQIGAGLTQLDAALAQIEADLADIWQTLRQLSGSQPAASGSQTTRQRKRHEQAPDLPKGQYWGDVCKYGHDHGGGRSQRYLSSSNCITCQDERQKAKRANKKAPLNEQGC